MSGARNPNVTRPGIHMTRTVWDRVTDEAYTRGMSPSMFVEMLVVEGMQRLIPADQLRVTTRPVDDRPDIEGTQR